MMMTGRLLAWVQKMEGQHFTLQVKNLFTETITFTPVFRLLLVMKSILLPLQKILNAFSYHLLLLNATYCCRIM